MKTLVRAFALLFFALTITMTDPHVSNIHAQALPEIGGQKVILLTRAAVSTTQPEFTSITVAPGRGMEILQITANFPGKGNVDVLASPDLAGAKKMLDVDDNDFGDLGYRLGSAFLVPYPNRIRGKLSADGKTLTTEWQGHSLTLPANNSGRLPRRERHAMHGLILKAKTDDIRVKKLPGGEAGHRHDPCGRLRRPLALQNQPGHHHHALAAMPWMPRLRLTTWAAKPSPWPSPGTPTLTCPPATARRPGCDSGLQRGRGGQLRQRLPTGKLCPSREPSLTCAPPAATALGNELLRRQLEPPGVEGRRRHGSSHRPGRALWDQHRRPVAGDQDHPDVRAAQQELCGHRAPVQLRRSLRQGMERDGHRHGDAEAGAENQVARPAAFIRAVRSRCFPPVDRQAGASLEIVRFIAIDKYCL